jgi:glycosyltransferase involved in cell wall biosynthesis
MSNNLELSVVMPCLNEADTLEICIQKAHEACRSIDTAYEIIVADNGSTDDSTAIAEKAGARVVPVDKRGYGAALMGGIEAAQGKYIIMADADDSYDFLQIPRFVEELREGYDIVQGCRLPSGGGNVQKGAMPWSHRWIGNPFFSLLVRAWFKAPIHDVYCGMRGFSKAWYSKLGLRCTGMEFATEMIVKSSLLKGNFAEVPITLHPDGRTAHAPHLKTFRDGWRTLRFFLMLSPKWLFLIPGFILMSFGFLGYALALPGLNIGTVHFDAHTLLFASLFIISGYQSVVFAVFAKTFAMISGILPEDARLLKFFDVVTLERGLILSMVSLLVGSGLLLGSFLIWKHKNFGDLDYAETMRWVIPGAMLFILGVQNALSSFFVSMLGTELK